MLQPMELQSATSYATTAPFGLSLDNALQASRTSAACGSSSRFDNISADIQSEKTATEEFKTGELKTEKLRTGKLKTENIRADNIKAETGAEVVASVKAAEKAPVEKVPAEKTVIRKSVASVGMRKENVLIDSSLDRLGSKTDLRSSHWKFFGESVNQDLKVDEVVEKLESGQLWVVNSRRRNGLIVLREFHAEFAGPGAAVGGDLDAEDIVGVIPIGNLSLLSPDSHEAHQNAIKIRLQWIRLTQNFTDRPCPDDRARMILEQFKTYFDQDTVDLVPDRAFAMLVGVLPRTIRRVRDGFVW